MRGDASQDDGEDEDTNTGDKRLPFTGHAMSVRGILTLTGVERFWLLALTHLHALLGQGIQVG